MYEDDDRNREKPLIDMGEDDENEDFEHLQQEQMQQEPGRHSYYGTDQYQQEQK